ncbi:hypothetical protein [Brucella sp. IR073]|uniref:hypothetical protein n=1 Tax=unclassified Brucella TaxID=2632610 RepID=UPI003B97EE1E
MKKNEEKDWREATRAASGLWRGREDVEVLSKELRERAKARFAERCDQDKRPDWLSFKDEPLADEDFLRERPPLIQDRKVRIED